MIDTITLMTTDFDYDPRYFTKKITEQQKCNPFIFDEKKSEYKKPFVKEHCNNPVTGSSFEIVNGYLYYTVSIPRIMYGNSLHEVENNDFDQAVHLIKNEFKTMKITTAYPVHQLELARLDYCNNIIVDNPIKDYMQVLNMQTISRKNKMNWKDETILFKNKSSEFTAYNKIKQLIASGHNVQGHKENVLRFESRDKKPPVIKRNLRSFCPVLKYTNINNLTFQYAFNSELSRKRLIKDFNSFKISEVDIIQEYKFNDMQLLEYLKKQNSDKKRFNLINHFIQLKGQEKLADQYGQHPGALAEIYKNYVNRSTASRQMKKFNEYNQQTRPYIKALSDELSAKLMNEIDCKLEQAA